METNRDRLRAAIRNIEPDFIGSTTESVTAAALKLSSQYPQSGMKIDEIEREIRVQVGASKSPEERAEAR